MRSPATIRELRLLLKQALTNEVVMNILDDHLFIHFDGHEDGLRAGEYQKLKADIRGLFVAILDQEKFIP